MATPRNFDAWKQQMKSLQAEVRHHEKRGEHEHANVYRYLWLAMKATSLEDAMHLVHKAEKFKDHFKGWAAARGSMHDQVQATRRLVQQKWKRNKTVSLTDIARLAERQHRQGDLRAALATAKLLHDVAKRQGATEVVRAAKKAIVKISSDLNQKVDARYRNASTISSVAQKGLLLPGQPHKNGRPKVKVTVKVRVKVKNAARNGKPPEFDVAIWDPQGAYKFGSRDVQWFTDALKAAGIKDVTVKTTSGGSRLSAAAQGDYAKVTRAVNRLLAARYRGQKLAGRTVPAKKASSSSSKGKRNAGLNNRKFWGN